MPQLFKVYKVREPCEKMNLLIYLICLVGSEYCYRILLFKTANRNHFFRGQDLCGAHFEEVSDRFLLSPNAWLILRRL